MAFIFSLGWCVSEAMPMHPETFLKEKKRFKLYIPSNARCGKLLLDRLPLTNPTADAGLGSSYV